MLVLTRKLDEQILIGDDIKVTLIRVRGNTVRLGIEAPRDVRVVRGELELRCNDEDELSEREHAFAHPAPVKAKSPQPKSVKAASRKSSLQKTKTLPKNRVAAKSRVALDDAPKAQLFVGTVRASGDAPKLKRAPLADYVAAS